VSRALDLTQRQVKALCEGAKKGGCIARVHLGKSVIELIPEDHAVLAQEEKAVDLSEDEILDAELAAFEAEHGDD